MYLKAKLIGYIWQNYLNGLIFIKVIEYVIPVYLEIFDIVLFTRTPEEYYTHTHVTSQKEPS